nr:DUF6088 family protein [uncultured Duganella sp.]
MPTLAHQILQHATALPEGTPLVAKALLHLGNRAAVDQVLSRLVRRSVLLRVGRGIYALPVAGRFGTRAPSTEKVVEGLAQQHGETIVAHGAAAANALGLTTQVPMRAVYLTSGPNRRLKLGANGGVPPCAVLATDVARAGRRRCGARAGVAGTGKRRASHSPATVNTAVVGAAGRRRGAFASATWMAQEISALVPHA